MKNKFFCPVPWLNISIDVNGSFRPCCKFIQPSEPGAVNLGNFKDKSIEALWNGPEVQRLRQEFLNGKQPLGCRSCWDEEAVGVESLRQNFVREKIGKKEVLQKYDFSSSVSPGPLALDLKLSQKCNFKCRICSPVASSTFLNEAVKNGLFQIDPRDKEFLISKKIFNHPESVEWFKRIIPEIQHVELFGGEPMLIEENREVERYLIESGYASQISLLYNTNGSIYLPEVVRSFENFRKVTICLSIDDIEARFEYQRSPGRWDVIEKNVKRYLGESPANTEVVIFCSVSVLNIWSLPDYLEWWSQLCPERYLHLNIVHGDRHFNVSYLADAVKEKIQLKLEKAIRDFDLHNMSDQLRGLIKFLWSNNYDENNFKNLKKQIALRDVIRGERFENVYPEFSNILFSEES